MEEKQFLLQNLATLKMIHANLESFIMETSNVDAQKEYHEAIMSLDNTIKSTEQVLKEM
ncbi:DUF1657 domain-containing protein [Bacillus sp. FJAT-45066]|uniref:DUF1657 domain-containing protein n=1 Tax=Bacillus sp. FJAT-45066 TaxID=2011010 RepID=UPI000BB743E6|nr:DUF1657 domain-containing protein [Bacillus sp. FJAT-45066]